MDSSSLLLHLLANGYEVTALGFDYGQKHKIELERAKSLVDFLNTNRFAGHDNVPGEFIGAFPVIKHRIIKLDGLSELLNSTLVEGGKDVPEGHYEQDNMKDTVVPNRNKIFASLIQAAALSIATQPITDDCTIGQEVVIAMGIHSGDHQIYPDCRQEFRDADFEAFKIGNWDSDLVSVYTPYLNVTKFEILEDGLRACEQLGLNFDEVYRRTNTSYKPIFIEGDKEFKAIKDSTSISWKSGKWYSDYKSAASVERIEAFIKLGRPDPVAYADETGPVDYETARIYVEQVLSEYVKEQLNK
jgi:7-cyano-7-deazaguanine synthase